MVNGGDGLIILSIFIWILRIILAVLLLVVAALAIPVRLEVGYTEKIKLTVKYLFLKFPIDLDKEKPKKTDKKKKIIKTVSGSAKQKKSGSVKAESNDRGFKKMFGKKEKQQKKSEPINAKSVDESSTDTQKTADKKSKKFKRKSKPQKEKKPKNKTVEKLKQTFKRRGLEGIVEIIKELAAISGGLLGCVFKHIVIVDLDLNIVVAFDDAYKTAVNYGYVCSGVYPGLAVILRVFKYKDYNVNITTDFDKKKPEIDVTADVSIIPWFVVVGAVQALIRFLKLKAKGLI